MVNGQRKKKKKKNGLDKIVRWSLEDEPVFDNVWTNVLDAERCSVYHRSPSPMPHTLPLVWPSENRIDKEDQSKVSSKQIDDRDDRDDQINQSNRTLGSESIERIDTRVRVNRETRH